MTPEETLRAALARYESCGTGPGCESCRLNIANAAVCAMPELFAELDQLRDRRTLLNERRELLTRSRLTKVGRDRIACIEKALGHLPSGETPENVAAMDIIRKAVAQLQEHPLCEKCQNARKSAPTRKRKGAT